MCSGSGLNGFFDSNDYVMGFALNCSRDHSHHLLFVENCTEDVDDLETRKLTVRIQRVNTNTDKTASKENKRISSIVKLSPHIRR